MKINIAILMPDNDVRKRFITPEGKRKLEEEGNLTWNDGKYDPIIIRQMLKTSHVCITGWGCPTLDESILAGADHLRLVAHTGGSVATLVSDYMFDRGIRIISANNIYAESVAEGTLAYMLAALRRVPYYNKRVQDGYWSETLSPSADLLDQKVGLVGFGSIARHLAPMLRVFRADIRIYDPYVDKKICDEYGVTKADNLKDIFTECDVVSNLLPLTDSTYRIIDRALLECMPAGSLFVNTGRGGTVDEKALEDILISGHINAILDVFETEPLPPESRLRGLDNVILMPHIVGPPVSRSGIVGEAFAQDIHNLFNGLPLANEISKEYAARMTDDTKTKGKGKNHENK